MTSARRQEYCDGMAPYELRGKRTTCRKHEAAMGRKELAENDPIKDLYNRRRSAIRTEKNRGTITPEFSAAVYKLAEDHKYGALQDEVYAATQYRLDIEREQLYKDTEKLIKQERTVCAVRENREQFNQFCLNPAPPKLPLQEYIDRYQETKDEKYLS